MIDSFFGIHPWLVRSGRWAKMKPGEKDLYVFLMEESERCCTREMTVTDAQVTVAVGTSSRTLCNARKRLQEYGLITYRAGPGNKFRYVICNPKTGEPYPGDPRHPLVVPKKKSQAPFKAQHDEPDVLFLTISCLRDRGYLHQTSKNCRSKLMVSRESFHDQAGKFCCSEQQLVPSSYRQATMNKASSQVACIPKTLLIREIPTFAVGTPLPQLLYLPIQVFGLGDQRLYFRPAISPRLFPIRRKRQR